MASVIVLDASVLIALHNSQDPHHGWAMQFFKSTLDQKWQLSVLSFAEAMVHPAKAGKLDLFQQSVAGLGLEIREVPADSAAEIAFLRANTGLRMPDLLALYQAMQSNAALATTDKSLALKAGSLGLETFQP